MNIEQNLKYICLDIINQIENYEELKTIGSFTKEVEIFRERLNDDEIRIAVVGAFSSGKSTFINALIGKDILKHASIETTAVITRIINVNEDSSRCQTGEVIYRDGRRKELDNLNSLKEYTSTFSSMYDVVKQIKYVNIYIPLLNTKKNIIIIDTPGLNGIAKGHREQTIELVKEAHFCIYLLQRRGLSDVDVDFLNYIKKYQNNFIIIQNFIDEFYRMEGENVTDKVEEQKKILKEKVFVNGNEENNFKYCVCGVSAWQELVSVDENIKRYADDSVQEITSAQRREYHKKSGFDEYRKTLNEIFNNETIEKIQYGSTAWAIYQWIKELKILIDVKGKNIRDLYNLSKEKDFCNKLDKLSDKIKKYEFRQQQHLKNFVSNECNDIYKKEKKSLCSKIEKLKDEIFFKIDEQNELDILESYGVEQLPDELDNKIIELYKDLRNECENRIINLHQFIKMRIEEYSGISDSKDVCFEKVNIDLVKDNQERYKPFQNKIRSFKDDRDNMYREQEEELKIYNNIQKDITITKEGIKFLEKECEENKICLLKHIKKLGDEPAIEYRKEEVEVEKGGILGFLGLKKKETYTVEDTSKRDDWRTKKRKIENDYTKKIDELNRQKSAKERRLARLKNDKVNSKEKLFKIEQDIDVLDKNIEIEKERIEIERKHAKRELLQINKKRIQYKVQEYLLDNVQNIIDDEIEEIMKQIESNLKHQAQHLLKEAIENRLKTIENAKNINQPWENKISNIELVQEKLDKFIEKLEVYI